MISAVLKCLRAGYESLPYTWFSSKLFLRTLFGANNCFGSVEWLAVAIVMRSECQVGPVAVNDIRRDSLEGSDPGGMRSAWEQGANRDQGKMFKQFVSLFPARRNE